MSTERKQIRFGIIGLGLMGREFGSAAARWFHLLDDGPIPVLTGICDTNQNSWAWFQDNIPEIEIATADYRELLESDKIDAIYCAVPHNLHQQLYVDILNAGKHLLGEKPFGMDKAANQAIMQAVQSHPELVVRCSSELPYFPAAQKLIQWVKDKKYGRLMEVRAGFHHSSDMDLSKAINWKRMIEVNGEYGVMGDLGMHTQHIPFRMGWIPKSVSADLLNVADTRPDGKGGMVPCLTWDNATLTCKCVDPDSQKDFSMVLSTKRMDPGATNTWFIEVYGTEGSAKFSTHQPKAFYSLESTGKEQAWSQVDVGAGNTAIPTVTGGIFETGFSDAFQQMMGAYMQEFRPEGSSHPFGMVTPQETVISHQLLSAALESEKSGQRIDL